MKRLGFMVFSALFALGLAASGQAAPITFFGEDLSPGGTVPVGGNAETARNNFLSGLVGVGNEDFEGFANLTSIGGAGINISFPGSSGAITANLSGLGGICDQTVGGSVGGIGCGFQRFATSPDNYLQSASGGFDLAFSDPIAAFGFYGTDFGDFSGQVTMTLSNGAVEVIDIPHTQGSSAGGNVLFWGFIDPTTTYTDIAFTNTGGGSDVFGFDDMVIGDERQIGPVIPEPSSVALYGVSLLLAGMAGRRRRS
jgi:hypothetical protein